MSEPYILIEHGYVLYDPHSDEFIRIDECKIDCSMVFRPFDELWYGDRWDDDSFKLLYQAARASEKSTLDTYVLVPYKREVPRKREDEDDLSVNFSCAIFVKDYMDA